MQKRFGNAAADVAGSDGIERLIAEAPPEVLAAVERELLAEFEALRDESAATKDTLARAVFVIEALARIQSSQSFWPGAARFFRKFSLKWRLRSAAKPS